MLSRRPPNLHLPRGFALLAAVVLIAVISVIATVITVNLTGDNDAKRIAKVADVLKRLEVEMDSTTPAFRAQVGQFPGKLSHLGRRIVTGDKNDCRAAYSTPANWKGPYHIFPMLPGTYTLGPGFVANDSLERNPSFVSGTPAAGTLAIVIPNVTLSDAKMLGIVVDGVNNGLGKYVKFAITDPTTVRYHNPITSGC
jgi:type II secretory pathway pseudopilin PulG